MQDAYNKRLSHCSTIPFFKSTVWVHFALGALPPKVKRLCSFLGLRMQEISFTRFVLSEPAFKALHPPRHKRMWYTQSLISPWVLKSNCRPCWGGQLQDSVAHMTTSLQGHAITNWARNAWVMHEKASLNITLAAITAIIGLEGSKMEILLKTLQAA